MSDNVVPFKAISSNSSSKIIGPMRLDYNKKMATFEVRLAFLNFKEKEDAEKMFYWLKKNVHDYFGFEI